MILVAQDPDALAVAVTEAVVRAAQVSIAERGVFRIGLSGGSTPATTFKLLGGPAARERIDWTRCWIGFADERAVSPDHPDSNYRLVRETLLSGQEIDGDHVHRIEGESPDLDAAARAYAMLLEVPFDLLLLGVGEDGHTASLFPGSPLLAENDQRVAVVWDSPKPPARRISVTPRVIDEAREIAVLVAGDSKSKAVARALLGEGTSSEMPARLLRERDWYLDQGAARLLNRAP